MQTGSRGRPPSALAAPAGPAWAMPARLTVPPDMLAGLPGKVAGQAGMH